MQMTTWEKSKVTCWMFGKMKGLRAPPARGPKAIPTAVATRDSERKSRSLTTNDTNPVPSGEHVSTYSIYMPGTGHSTTGQPTEEQNETAEERREDGDRVLLGLEERNVLRAHLCPICPVCMYVLYVCPVCTRVSSLAGQVEPSREVTSRRRIGILSGR